MEYHSTTTKLPNLLIKCDKLLFPIVAGGGGGGMLF